MQRLNALSKVYSISGHSAVTLTTFARLVNYSVSRILQLLKRKKLPHYKWKRAHYIFVSTKHVPLNNSRYPTPEIIQLPSGRTTEINLEKLSREIPEYIFETAYLNGIPLYNVTGTFYVEIPLFSLLSSDQTSSPLSPKNDTSILPLSLVQYPGVISYKYGDHITYDPSRMSTFKGGTGGTLKSSQLPAALFEAARALDAAELNRNGNNPGIAPKRNLNTTISFQTGTIAIAATIPISSGILPNGKIDILAQDYLGAAYNVFNPGSGDGTLFSTDLISAFLEVANLLAAAEKAVTPAENQPNNIQIDYNLETNTATISANMPFTTSSTATGDVTVHAIDYL